MIMYISAERLSGPMTKTEEEIRYRICSEEGRRTIRQVTGEIEEEKFVRGETVSGRTLELWEATDGRFTGRRFLATFDCSLFFARDVLRALVEDGVGTARVAVLKKSSAAILAVIEAGGESRRAIGRGQVGGENVVLADLLVAVEATLAEKYAKEEAAAAQAAAAEPVPAPTGTSEEPIDFGDFGDD